MDVFVTRNQLNDFGVTFHQLALCKGKCTSETDVEANGFQCVHRVNAQEQFLFNFALSHIVCFTVDRYFTFAVGLPQLGVENKVVVVL